MSEHIDLKDYISAAGDSSRRSRVIAIVLITASILSFMALWNSFQWSWLQHRMKAHEDVLYAWPLDDKGLENLRTLRSHIDEPKEVDERFKKAKDYVKKRLGINADTLNYVDDGKLQDIYKRISARLNDLYSVRTDQVIYLNIPFFGVSFDINDLGIFSGSLITCSLSLEGWILATSHLTIHY